jgi:tetratricopeptide (TPR) repeat protein
MKALTTLSLWLILVSTGLAQQEKKITDREDAIIQKYLKNGAWKYNYLRKEWGEWIDKGLAEDSTVAYLWQQKAMPLWKKKKYQLAISYQQRAVDLKPRLWKARLAFLKCIFAKDYQNALADFISYKKEFGSTFEQDHAIEFYMGICYLQLNQFDAALETLKANVEDQTAQHGADWVHYLDRFYLAVAYYEKDDYKAAAAQLDLVLQDYPNFSDGQYFKSLCLNQLGKKEEAKALMQLGKANYKKGHTFNEDSNPYEVYPYQQTWQWKSALSMLH